MDEWTRECLAIDVGRSIRSARVIEVLSRLISVRGAPLHLRSDNGPEFVSAAILRWLTDNGIKSGRNPTSSFWLYKTVSQYGTSLSVWG